MDTHPRLIVLVCTTSVTTSHHHEARSRSVLHDEDLCEHDREHSHHRKIHSRLMNDSTKMRFRSFSQSWTSSVCSSNLPNSICNLLVDREAVLMVPSRQGRVASILQTTSALEIRYSGEANRQLSTTLLSCHLTNHLTPRDM